MVEVTAMNHLGKTNSVPIANLHLSCLPMVPHTPLTQVHAGSTVEVCLNVSLLSLRSVWETLS